jgi:bifunctional enzyme CysN/CysC
MTSASHALGLLRVLTCGSVDDGKSTLIGRLLHECDEIMDDAYAAIVADSQKYSTVGKEVDFALLVDGLEEERQQRITIDVAYRYFATPRRAFIVADCPGHEQYTRNMATGASNSDLAIILVDARKGLLTQTKRHAYICSLLGIRHVVLAVNKIDLVDYDEGVFTEISEAFSRFAEVLGFSSVTPLPVSGRFADNVARRSERTPWYAGVALLDHLETVDVEKVGKDLPLRFLVHWVNRPHQDFRGFSGIVTSGALALGTPVQVSPSGAWSVVARILGPSGEVGRAAAGDAVTVCLADEVDVARGDVLACSSSPPEVADQFAAHLLWMDETAMLPGRQYAVRIGNTWTVGSVTAIKHRVQIAALEHEPASRLEVNEIAFCSLSLSRRVAFDPYTRNRELGAFILVDRFTNRTVGCGMIAFALRRASTVRAERFLVDKAARSEALRQRPMALWFTGLSGSGKSTVAKLVEQALHEGGAQTYSLDGDNLRRGLNKDLGFTDQDRVENIRRVGEVARLFVDAGLIVLCSFISPFIAERRMVREMFGPGEFVEIFVDTPLEECMRRDAKGLYQKALEGKLPNFTGVSSPYEPPIQPELVLHGAVETPEALAHQVITLVARYQAQRTTS